MGTKYIINVPVASIWTNPESVRDIDSQTISNPAFLEEWLDEMTYDDRLALCDQNLLQTQALIGEEVDVIHEIDGWSEIILLGQPTKKHPRGYPGWIPSIQLTEVSDWNLDEMVAVVTSKQTVIYLEDETEMMKVSYQTVLPILEEKQDEIVVQLPVGTGILKASDVEILSSLAKRPMGLGQQIINSGERFLGLPYLWGGTSSYGYDCSGFTFSMCKANGYVIPRDADDQFTQGLQVNLEHIEPGDLLFFAYEEGKGTLHHVGLYYGEGKLLHSPNTGRSIEIIDLAGTIYEKELCGACRYWTGTEE